jgi:thiamine-phosphate pyrophosphorylase
MSLKSWGVYLVTDRAHSRGRSTLEIIEAAVAGGVSAVQLREKNLEAGAFYVEGLKIRDFLKARNVPLIINDRVDIALALEADGAHLGQSDLPIDVARRILGKERIIGLSVTEPAQINEKALSYADYLGISPVFLTATKPDANREWGLGGLGMVRQMTDLPLIAIGSIKMNNAGDVISAGADCVAVVTEIVSADDCEAAARGLCLEVAKAKKKRD